MKIAHHLKELLTFNRQEQRGIMVLLAILCTVTLAGILLDRYREHASFDYSQYEKEIEAFEKELRRQDSLEEAEKKSRYLRFAAGFRNYRQDTARNAASYAREAILIELNAADTFELQRLKGIGPSFARRIVGYRERLGGYVSKSQLLEVFGMDASRYSSISGNLTVNKDSVHPLDLNTVTFKQLLAHPYFPYGTAKAILIYRKEHQRFSDINDLRNIPGINDSVMEKIGPYITVEKPD
jgi:competence ComEA-like helix-hairpin-helix protein